MFFFLHLLQTESKLHRVKLSPGALNAFGSASDIWTLPRSGCSFPFMFLRMRGDLEQRRWTSTPLQSEFFRACHGNHIYFLNMSNLAPFLFFFRFCCCFCINRKLLCIIYCITTWGSWEINSDLLNLVSSWLQSVTVKLRFVVSAHRQFNKIHRFK